MLLQRLLNKAGAAPPLREDEQFGPRTSTAVVAFKQARTIAPPNGQVDAAVWTALGVRVEAQHNITLFGQPTNMTCWSAAATMIGGNVQSVGSGRAATGTDGGLSMPIQTIETFIAGQGWRMQNNQSRPGMSSLLPVFQRGPAWIAFEGGHFRHAVVASGVWGDGTDDGTVVRIHDPWPPGRGTVYGTAYVDRTMRLRSTHPPSPAMIQYVAQ